MKGISMCGRALLLTAFALAALMSATGCSRTRLSPGGEYSDVVEGCSTDDDCEDGFICVFGECIPIEEFNCRGGEEPLLELSPPNIEFGEVPFGQNSTQTLNLRNVGPCNLNVLSAGLSDSGDFGFTCSPCDPTSYPTIVAPNHAVPIEVSYTPFEPGEASGSLLVRTDDITIGTNGLIKVDLHASYSGVPALQITPPELNFGYVPFSSGTPAQARTETIRVTNAGTGNAALTIEFIYLRPGTDFEIPPEFSRLSPASPQQLPPYDPTDPTSWIDIPVTFTPSNNSDQETSLVVQAARIYEEGEAPVASTRLAASSLGPPHIQVSPTTLHFRDSDGGPLALGRTAYQTVTVQNTGQSELTLDLGLDDPVGDFTFSPPFVAPLLPGSTVALNLLYNPSEPSDPANPGDPQNSADAYFRILSNDQNTPLTTVALHGWSHTLDNDDVLRLEMSFENSDGSWSQNDFRNVDLEVVSPLGYSCKKPVSEYTQGPDGTYAVSTTTDFCGMWSDTGLEGTATWIPGGVFEEPERVLLYGLGTDLADNQNFTINAHYIEDCANVPTGIVADLAGIGVSALLGILGGQVGVPITIPPDQITSLIETNCWSRESSLVTITAFINGSEIHSSQVRLQSRGDVRSAFRVLRSNGTFSIIP